MSVEVPPMRMGATTNRAEGPDAPLADTTDTAPALNDFSSTPNPHAVANLAVLKNRAESVAPKETYWHAAD